MSDNKPNLDSLFLAASEIESKAGRDAFLAEACGDDLDLRQQIEQLLQSDQHAGSFLEKPAPGLEATIGTYQVKLAPPGYESVIFLLGGDAYVYDAANPVIPGTLFCEIFNNIKGGTVEDLTSSKQYQNKRWNYPRSLKAFEAPPNDIGSFGDNYGIRVTGFIKPPKTGEYVFYLASDDEGELYLSSDESTDNLELVASVKRGPSGIGSESGRTNKRAWGANPSAVSKSIHLEAGKRYSVNALMKEDSAQDHLSVTWQMPGNPPPKPGDPPIAGEYLEFEVKK